MSARKSRLVVRSGRVFDLDGDPHSPGVADILIEDGVVRSVTPHGQAGAIEPVAATDAELVDAAGKLVMPGFVNAHYHSHDVLLKGYFDPLVLEAWVLNALPRNYGKRGLEELRIRTMLGAAECIRSGITTVQDMVTLFPLDAEQVEVVARAYEAVGIRVVLGLQVANVSPLDTVPYWREVIPPELHPIVLGPPAGPAPDPLRIVEDEIVGHRDDRPLVTWALAPSSPERCTRPMLERIAALSQAHDLPVCSHIYISKAEALNARQRFGAQGGSLISYLREVGLLGPRLTLAHGVWLLPEEIDALAEAGSSVVINAVSNLKARNGVAPIRALREAGVNLALGCDNCSCSDAQNMFQAMKLFTLLAAVSDPRPEPPTALDAIRAGTLGGARAAGLAGAIGAIRPGMKADLAIFDLADPAFVPLNSVARQLVFGECGRGVETVIIDGRVVMRDRSLVTIDETALWREIEQAMVTFRPEAAAVMARNARLAPYIDEADRRIWAQDVGLHRYTGQ